MQFYIIVLNHLILAMPLKYTRNAGPKKSDIVTSDIINSVLSFLKQPPQRLSGLYLVVGGNILPDMFSCFLNIVCQQYQA